MTAYSKDQLMGRLVELAQDADESGIPQLSNVLMLIYRCSSWPRATRIAIVNLGYMIVALVETLLPSGEGSQSDRRSAGV